MFDSLRRIFNIAAGDVKITVKERSLIIWIFLMPLAFMFFFGTSIGGGSGGVPKATITIENRDSGFLSRDLIEALEDENLQLVDSLAEGANPIRTLIIPEKFTRNILSRSKTELVLRKEKNTNFDAGRAASTAIFRSLVNVGAGLLEIETEEVKRGDSRFIIQSDSVIGSLWNLSGGEIEETKDYEVRLDSILAREPAISLKDEFAGKAEKIPGGFQSSVPGSLVMFVLMGMVFSGTAIAVERASGVLKRIAASPARKMEIVTGKLFGRMVVSAAQILFLLAAGKLLFGITLGNSYIGLALLMAVFAFSVGSFALLFGSLFSDPDQVTGFAVLTTLALSSLGGCWWPLEIVSKPFRVVAFFLPTGWTMDGLHKIISYGYGLSSIITNILILALFGIFFLVIASKKLKITM
ncbi:MAG TPA: ABC transporter permease [Candidatus Krumholzibacteriaceae bacterium]|nr:ABC transporter permease [Candidatus Krumholzibacteriaceae bacterium]